MRRGVLIGLALLAASLTAPSPARAAGPCDLPAGPSAGLQHVGPTDYRRYLQPLGELRAILLFVDFSDAPGGTESTERLTDLLVPKAAAYYAEASYGRMTLAVDARQRWYRLPNPSTAYDLERGDRAAFLADVVRAADADVDFGAYPLFYVVLSRGSAYRGVNPVAFPPTRGVLADGRELRHGVMLGTVIYESPPGAEWIGLAHETGHVFGLPDIYDLQAARDARSLLVGPWDIMGWTSALPALAGHFFAWHKRKLGWLDEGQLACIDTRPAQVTLTPLEQPGGVKALVVPTGPSTALVAEARRRTGFDAALCGEGVLVYTVDTSLPTGQGPIRVRPAQGGSGTCGPLSFAAYGSSACVIENGVKLEIAGLTVNVSAAGEPCAAPAPPPAAKPKPKAKPKKKAKPKPKKKRR